MATPILKTEITKEQKDNVKSQIVSLAKAAVKYGVIKTDDDMKEASEQINLVSAKIKELEEKRKSLVGPLNDVVKTLNNDFKEFTNPLTTLLNGLKKSVGSYLDKKDREAKLLAEKEAAKIEKKEEKLADALSSKNPLEREMAQQKIDTMKNTAEQKVNEVMPGKINTGAGSVSSKMLWKFEITNPTAVPVNYLMIDEAKIKQAIKDGIREINGVRIYQERSLSSLSK